MSKSETSGVQASWGRPNRGFLPGFTKYSRQCDSSGPGAGRCWQGGGPPEGEVLEEWFAAQGSGRQALQAIQRALHAAATLPQDVGADHRRGHVVVPQQLLNGPDVRTVKS